MPQLRSLARGASAPWLPALPPLLTKVSAPALHMDDMSAAALLGPGRCQQVCESKLLHKVAEQAQVVHHTRSSITAGATQDASTQGLECTSRGWAS